MRVKTVAWLSRESAGRLMLLAVLGICGGILAYSIARIVLFQTERSELEHSAQISVENAGRLGAESFAAMEAVAKDGLPLCSDREIAFMRNLVFNSLHIRDVGRSRDGKVDCSAGVGRVSSPARIGPPDIAIRGVQFWTSTGLMISSEAHGFVLERDGVSVVLNPETFKTMEEPPPRYVTGFLYDRSRDLMVRRSGNVIPLNKEEIAAGRFVERQGVYYQPLCPERSMACMVAYEARTDFLAKIRPVSVAWALAGVLTGMLLGFMIIFAALRRRTMESQLRRAIRRGGLDLAYQPIVDLDSGMMAGVEALARWSNDDGEPVAPDVFVPLAESKGFVTEITRSVMRCAIKDLGDLLVDGDLRMSVNITAQDLMDPGFLAELERCVSAAGILPGAIGLELTERSMVDYGAATEALAQLKVAGYRVYIDDFGTGYSSLAYLHRLGVDALKIDQAFTQTIGTGAVTASVVPQILDMARQLDLLVVVEGIETEEQAEYFRQSKAGSLGQGWLFGRALPVEEIRKLIQQRSSMRHYESLAGTANRG